MMREALIVVDMSNDFVADNGALSVGKLAQDIVPYITGLATKFLSEGNTALIAMDAHQKNDPHFRLWPPHNIVNTEGQRLYGDLYKWYQENKDHDDVIYLLKSNYNAFFETGLAEMLRSRGTEKVHIAGVATDICDFLTVAGADAEGFETVVHKRGVATFTDGGETMITHMKRCFHTEIIE